MYIKKKKQQPQNALSTGRNKRCSNNFGIWTQTFEFLDSWKQWGGRSSADSTVLLQLLHWDLVCFCPSLNWWLWIRQRKVHTSTSVRVQWSCQGSRPSQTFILCDTTVQLHHKCWDWISMSEERRKCVLPPVRAPFLWSVAWNNVCFWRCWHEHDRSNCGGEFWPSLLSSQPSESHP